ncbi:putative bifunctional diguanylate cyclase/phosphodiesterase [Cryptosporangium arvum]|uniref:Diguanylate cyclase (GGDEF) domain-containing protein n=1 Tax=Cryptosporangium arvum DSM 44712 TaxID=927661 RepID=A0A010YRK1_9ACTN|nr:bifunctional diguanylate cyclase/phosphodiesterase [Cryptosporangium arvum]EXG82825.1 diguanylate cyclase (GGDEF) domain-containing protein [Cryptosporangium arvum DSM 44712]
MRSLGDLVTRRSLRPSVVATRRAMAVTAAVACTVGGLIGLLGMLVRPSNETDDVIRLASVASMLAGLALAKWGQRLPPLAFYLLAESAALLIAVSVWLQRDRPDAAAVAALLLLVTVFFFAFFDPVASLPGLVTVLGALAVIQVGWGALPWSTVLVLAGLNLLIAAVVGWLVRAAADSGLDVLTGLPNWRGLERAGHAALQRARHRGQPLTVALLNIDGFARINSTSGIAEGTRILRACGQAWATAVAPPAVLGRTAGDDFVLLVPGLGLGSVGPLLDALRAVAPPFVRFSVGVAGYAPGDAVRTLLNRADGALRLAKAGGGDRTVYARDDSADAQALVSGLDADEFRVLYQPIADARTGRVTGAEALVRWVRAGHGPVPPDEFIPLAERCGFITTLGEWVLRTACRDAAAWPRTLPSKVTVNVSGQQMQRPDYADHVLSVLAETGLPADRLVLEVTESTLQADSPCAIDALRALREAGVRIAIDDFGTGYSSLSRLQHLPADILKIDQSFVAALKPEDHAAPLVAAVTALAHALGLRTVAEGVEEHYQTVLLAHHGCDEVQGWLHGRPGEPARIGEALAEQERSARAAPTAVEI